MSGEGMTIKEYLRQARKEIKRHKRDIQFKKENIAESYAIITNSAAPVTDVEKIKSSGGYDRFPHVLSHIEETEKEIDAVAATMFAKQAEIRLLIDVLPRFEQRRILSLYYIKALEWGEVFTKMSYSERHVYRIHGEALRALEKRWQ